MHFVPDSSTAAPFIHFAEVCEQLVRTTRKLEKRALLADYLRSLLPRDAALAALYLAGQPFPATDRRQLNIGGSLLSRVLSQVSGASEHRMHAAYLRHGDLGGAAEDLLNEAKGRRPVAPTLTLQEVEAAFAAIADAAKPLARQHLVSALFERSTPLECKYLIKITLGDMRTGVKESLVEEAIAAAFEAEIAQVRRTMMLQGSLAEVVTLAAEHRLNQATMKLFHPLGFMLASPVETVDEALRRFSES
ncbi:MAG TPA: ATP-dependent DNA ligase, partial [Acidobacteriaceae bacterium]|nr:ATP-dependent DNA ligase [Acidobacteriaceae bacterium]